MDAQQRCLLAIGFVLVDVVAVVVPLVAILAAHVLITRPPWFREWVEKLYENIPRE